MLEREFNHFLVGAELELEIPRDPVYDFERAYRLIDKKACVRDGFDSDNVKIRKMGIFKFDRTIKYGFEYATIPYPAWFWLTNKNVKSIFKFFKGQRTKTGDHVGMHVHVDKGILTKEQIEKINYFVFRNSRFCRVIGEREVNKYCRVEENTEQEIKINGGYGYICDVKNRKNHKHRMLNVARGKTIEFRFFKSTNDYDTFIKNMQFVIALVNFVKSSKMTLEEFKIGGATMVFVCDSVFYDEEAGLDIIVDAFCKYVKKYRGTYKQLFKFLKIRKWI